MEKNQKNSPLIKEMDQIILGIVVAAIVVILIVVAMMMRRKKMMTTTCCQKKTSQSPFDIDSLPPSIKPFDGKPPVVIIGGGLSGLITAYKLAQANIPFVILESQSYLGGRIATIKYPNGDTSEAPLEEYWARNPAVELLRELGVEMIEENAHSSMIINKQIRVGNGDPDMETYLSNMLPNPEDRKRFIEWNNKTWKLYQDVKKYCLEPHKSHMSTYQEPPTHLKKLMTISFADYVRDPVHKLSSDVREWIRMSLEPEIATEWDTISALDGIDEFRIFLGGATAPPLPPLSRDDGNDEKGVGRHKGGVEHVKLGVAAPAFGESCYHLKKGNTEFIKQLVGRLPPHSIKLNCVVGDIKSGEPGFPIVSYLQNHPIGAKDLIHMEASYVVLTVPIHGLQHIRFTPPLDVEKRVAINTNKIGSYIKVHFCFDRDAEKFYLPKYGHNLFTLITNEVIGAIYNSTGGGADAGGSAPFSPVTHNVGGKNGGGDSSDKNTTSNNGFKPGGERGGVAPPLRLTALVYGHNAKKLVHLDDNEIKNILVANMEKLFPGITSDQYLQEVEVFSFPKAVAHWPIQYKRSRFDELAHHLRKPIYGDRVFIGGDMTYGSHSEGAALSALAISDDIKLLHSSARKSNQK